MEKKTNIDYFTQLEVWQESLALAKEIYLITKKFPSEEKFGLISQLQRASVSISSNIAEGCGRFHPKDSALSANDPKTLSNPNQIVIDNKMLNEGISRNFTLLFKHHRRMRS